MVVLTARRAKSILSIGHTVWILDNTETIDQAELIFALVAVHSFVGEAIGVNFDAIALV